MRTSLRWAAKGTLASLCLWLSACGGEAGVAGADGLASPQVSAIGKRAMALSTSMAEEQNAIAVVALAKLSEVRISRTTYEYVFRVTARNNGTASRGAVQLTPTSSSPFTMVQKGTANFPGLVAGRTAESTSLVTLRHDRTVPFDPAKIIWTDTTPKVRGRVIDGYIRGAVVFWDCNASGAPEPTEISTTSLEGGQYGIWPAPSPACALMAYVPIGAIDESVPERKISKAFTMAAIPGAPDVISPYTTLVAGQMDMGATLEASKKSVQDALGIGGTIFADYVAAGDATATKVAAAGTAAIQGSYQAADPFAAASKALSPLTGAGSVASADALAWSSFLDKLRQPTYLLPMLTVTQADDDLRLQPRTDLTDLSTSQQLALALIAADPAFRAVVINGVPRWDQMPDADFDRIRSLFIANGLTANFSSEVAALRAERKAELEALNATWEAKLAASNTVLSADAAKNFDAFTSIVVATVDGIDGAVSSAGGKLAKPVLKTAKKLKLKIFKNGTKTQLKDSKKAVQALGLLANALKASSGTLALAEGISKKSDGAELSEDEVAAVEDLLKSTYNVLKTAIKEKSDFMLVLKPFEGAIALFDECSACLDPATNRFVYSAKCGQAYIGALEATAEAFDLTRMAGMFRMLRAGFDSYLASDELAKAVDKEVGLQVLNLADEWKQRREAVLARYKRLEFEAQAYDWYFDVCKADVCVTTPVVPTVGLVGHWKFDDCASGTSVTADSSGLGRDVSYGAICVGGKLGSALEFRNGGYNTYGGVHSVHLPAHTAASITFSAWVKWLGSVQSGDTYGFAGALWSLGVHGLGPFMSIWVNEGGVASDGGTIWTDRFMTSTYRLKRDEWTMVSITSDGTRETLYLNGEPINTATYASAVSYKGLPSYVSKHFWNSYGGGPNDWAARFRGVVDDVRVYDRSLSDAEVRALYSATR